jgi:hypothetical protein
VILVVSEGTANIILIEIDLIIWEGRRLATQRTNISKAGPNMIGGLVEQSVMLLIAVAQGAGWKEASWMRRALLYG